jgi:pyruvate-formate lyase-activating enzyme
MAKPSGAICNLDCAYCFFLSKERLYPRDRFRMSDEVLREWVRQTIEAHRSPEVDIAFQGGEPTLLGLDFFRRAVAYAREFGGNRPLQFAIQTNGILLDDAWTTFLRTERFLVGLSIDGPADMHDTYRVDKREASDIADVAERVFEINGVADRVTLLRGWSREVELPHAADLLVTEVIGNEPLEEEILETTLDARRRLLKPAARLVPSALTLFARPLLLPESEIRQRSFGRAAVARWRALYGMDFEPLLDATRLDPVYTVTEGEVVGTWPQAGAPVALCTIDLGAFEAPSVCGRADLTVDAPGLVNAIAVTFCASLYDGVAHTLDPWLWPASSWATSVWVFSDTLEVDPQSALRIHYRRRVRGYADGLAFEVVRSH